jgi:hypothetical protein
MRHRDYADAMPSTVADVFAAAGLQVAGAVRWGTPVPLDAPGVYAVALTDDPNTLDGALHEAPIDLGALKTLLAARPELQLDGRRPSPQALAARLVAFWLPDEVVLYVGLAGTSVRKRVRQYYTTLLGARRPHAGGWWLKTLSVLDELWVHWAGVSDPSAGEQFMLGGFKDAVAATTRCALHDQGLPSPFANLRTGAGSSKDHGITGSTGDLTSGAAKTEPGSRTTHAGHRQGVVAAGDGQGPRGWARPVPAVGETPVPSRADVRGRSRARPRTERALGPAHRPGQGALGRPCVRQRQAHGHRHGR